MELFLCSSPVAYWAPTNLESSSFHVISFCLFILFMGFSRQEYWSGLRSLPQWATFCQNSSPWLLDSINRHDTSNITSHFLSLFFRNLEPWNKEKKKNCLQSYILFLCFIMFSASDTWKLIHPFNAISYFIVLMVLLFPQNYWGQRGGFTKVRLEQTLETIDMYQVKEWQMSHVKNEGLISKSINT